MKFFCLFVFMLTSTVLASECSEEYKFKFDSGEKEICLLKEKKILVSNDCQKSDCEAIKVLSSKKMKEVKIEVAELEGGKNPSTLLCKKLNGKLLLATSELSHQHYFCQFEDDSLIATSSLYAKFQE